MEINIQELVKALGFVKPGLANKEMIEQTTSFMFMRDRVITYNSDISLSAPVENMDLQGAVKAEELHKFLLRLKGEVVKMEQQEGEIVLSSNKSRAGLRLVDIGENIKFSIPVIPKNVKWEKLPENFVSDLSFVMNSCSSDMSDVKLTAVHIRKDGKLEASDGYCIAMANMNTSFIQNVMLPATIAAEVIKIKPIVLSVVGSWIHFKTDQNVILSGRLIEGDYVDTAPHLKVSGKKFIFPKMILEVLERAVVFSKRDFFLDELVTISLSNKYMTIASKSDTGWFEEMVRFRYDDNPLTFAMPPYILQNILGKTKEAIIGENAIHFVEKDWHYMALLRSLKEVDA
ncbi:MAG: hypothetical protein PHC31_01010 [Clostridia bacterium]|nr:hypothetical protein [Clostridia bacterium]MDD3970473.1 hypothetical protein [Clostridia bacterium]